MASAADMTLDAVVEAAERELADLYKDNQDSERLLESLTAHVGGSLESPAPLQQSQQHQQPQPSVDSAAQLLPLRTERSD